MRNKWILFFIVAFSLVSCKKFLTQEPADFVEPEANYQSKAQLTNALAGVYDVLGYGRQQLYANFYYTYVNACTDLSFYARASQTTGIEVYNFDYTDEYVNGMWEALYVGIERANDLIAYIDNASKISEEDKDAILGETLFLRGYYYFLLVSQWGGVPIRTDPTTLTGAKSTSIPRNTAEQVYQQILDDMTTAESLVYPATHFNDVSHVNKSVVQGILARVCLTMAGSPLNDTQMYAEARKWARKVIDSGVHSLIPDYKKIFIDELQGNYDADFRGVIWEAQFHGNNTDGKQQEGRLGNTNGIQFTNADLQADSGYGYGFIDATKKLYNLYEDGDLRRDWTIATYKYKNNGDRSYLGNIIYDRNAGKWRRQYELPNPKNKNFNGTNFPILRYADVLLMFAEADNRVNAGPTADAYEAVNEVRRRGFGLPIDQPNNAVDIQGLGEDGFQKEIIDERARELAFECLRRPDLIRWGIWTQTMREVANQMENDLNDDTNWNYASLGAKNAAASSRFLLLPIPSTETSVNKAIVQNPGY